MQKMTHHEYRNFLLEGTRTGKLATVRNDGRPHVVPIWFDFDGETIVSTTGGSSIKATNMRRDPRVCVCVDDQIPPFAYVQIEGTAAFTDNPDELLYWATRIGGRYMGAELAEAYGKRNSVEGELLVRVNHPKLSPIRTSPVVKNFKSSLVLDQINFEPEAYARAPFMVRQACPECSRRAHHERLSLNTARPELSRRAYFIG
jgi:PPOX class probable F420-dependent enzyme